ncbi:hypothetical protein [Leptothoe spongobia]|uniref:Uncharacterized protein n=1 Tax=Leptothoe spongobia TAU-MAC 1115 TaxID=1967444 RepID=A0A947GH53_9CYAN|nr:hypothetical protein [Leptothoe spongobia]MBT9314473.1 hypothetical protein [Leptothoe spongobia TAU-MAC 1115]
MKEQLKQRLQELRTEYTSGQKVLTELEAKQANLQNTLLRIQGAIQVLEEELTKADELLSNGTADLSTDDLVPADASHFIQTS